MKILQYLKSILWALLTLALGIIPGSSLRKVGTIPIPHFDKVVHFILFFILTLLLLYETAKRNGHKTLSLKTKTAVAVLTISYGAFLEVIQHLLVAGRTGSMLDILANSLGVFSALLVFYLIKRKNLLANLSSGKD